MVLFAACSHGQDPPRTTDDGAAHLSSESSAASEDLTTSPGSGSNASNDGGSGTFATEGTANSSATTGESTHSASSEDETGDPCTSPELRCAGACIDPRVDEAFCGAQGNCEGSNAGEQCGDGARCLDSVCRQLGWGAAQELTHHSETSGDALGLELASGLDSSTIAVWRQFDVEGFRPSVWESRYDTASQTWTTPTLLEAYPGQVLSDPLLVVDTQGVANVVWAHEFARKFRFEHTRLTSPDALWSPPSSIQFLSAVDASPQGLHVDQGGNLLLTWAQSQGNLRTQENYSAWYTATQASWSPPELVAKDTAGDVFRATAAVAVDGSAFTFWSHRNDAGVAKLRSRHRDPDESWKLPTHVLHALHAPMRRIADHQAAYDPSGALTLVWLVEWSIAGEVQNELWWARRSRGTWIKPRQVVPPAVQTLSPVLHVDNAGTAHLTWIARSDENSQIWYTRLQSDSTSWALEHELGETAPYTGRPILRTDDQRTLYAVWEATTSKNDAPMSSCIHTARLPEHTSEWIDIHQLEKSATDSTQLHAVAVHPDGDVSVGWRQLNENPAKLWVARYESGR